MATTGRTGRRCPRKAAHHIGYALKGIANDSKYYQTKLVAALVPQVSGSLSIQSIYNLGSRSTSNHLHHRPNVTDRTQN